MMEAYSQTHPVSPSDYTQPFVEGTLKPVINDNSMPLGKRLRLMGVLLAISAVVLGALWLL